MTATQHQVGGLAALPPIDWLPARVVLSPDHSPSAVQLDWQGPFAWAETKSRVMEVVPQCSGLYVFFEYDAGRREPLVWYVGESISMGDNRFRDNYAKGHAP